MLKLFKISLLVSLISGLFVPTFADITGLRSYLKGRDSMPRMYIPDNVFLGEAAEIVVVAPGADSVELLGSFEEAGIEDYDQDLNLKLGKEFKSWGKKDIKEGSNRVAFALPFTDEASIDKNYFVEAVISYKDGGSERVEKAFPFGSSASYIPFNFFRISAQPKKGGAASLDLVRTLLPGLGPINTGR
jgi:hypothetical protein